MTQLIDSFGRHIEYIRVSVTDHCNYHCFYCRPEDDVTCSSQRDLLSYQDLTRLIRVFTELGVTKVRLTGGEPLVRRNLVDLVAMLGQLPGLDDLSLSTNGHLLERFASPLKQAGVNRVNISLDSIDEENFSRITRGGDLNKIIRGIDASNTVGMTPMKINMVVMKGINEHEIERMLDFAILKGLELRFIETMPIGKVGASSMTHHYPVDKILTRVRQHFGSRLIPLPTSQGAGPARYYQVGDRSEKIGVISAVSRHFCSSCNRVRLTAKGDLVLCLGKTNKVRLQSRAEVTDSDLKNQILEAIAQKPERHDFQNNIPLTTDMVSLGG